MRLKLKLHITIFICLAISSIAASIIYAYSKNLDLSSQRTELVDQVMVSVFDLAIISNDYLLHHGKHSVQQWKQKHQDLGKLLENLNFSTPVDQKIHLQIIKKHHDLEFLFDSLEKITNHKSVDPKLPDMLENRLMGQLSSNMEYISSKTKLLRVHTNIEQKAKYQKTRNSAIILFGLLILLTPVFLYIIYRSIIGPLVKMSDGVNKISAGDFNHQLDVNSNDEIGELSSAFNKMTNNLAKITVSRDELLEEIEERRKLENDKDELEKKLNNAQKMEAMGTLAGGIAHDFNNILSVIIGYADLAKENIQASNPASSQIDKVISAGNRAKELIRKILLYTRKEPQKQELIQFHLLVKEAIEFLRAALPKTIRMVHHIDIHSGNIIGDQTQLHQLLLNLCNNAAYAMEEKGGTLTIILEPIDITQANTHELADLKPGQHLRLTINDTGIGIAPDKIDKVFDPYFTTKSLDKGTGMGLAMVAGIVKSHDGAITINSKLNEGTSFGIYLPVADVDNKNDHLDEQILPKGNEKILFVDDESNIVELNKQRIENLGYQVTSKTDSTEALELFRSQPDYFDLVITDQTMPQLTGDKLAEKLIAIRPDIPIILCSGYSPNINSESIESIGIKVFIMKPINNNDLAFSIRNVLDNTIN